MKCKNTLGFLFVTFLFAFPGPGVYSLGLDDLIGHEYINALLAGETPVSVQFGSPRPALVPRNEFLQRQVEALRQDLGPSVIVEVLYLYRKPPGAEMGAWTAGEELRLYNEIVSLSTLAGIKYFSASRGEMRILYDFSHIIDGPSTRVPLPDPVFSQLPAEFNVYVRQRDLTFGDNVYRFDFFTSPGALIISMENMTALSVGIIRAIGRNNLRSAVAILDAGEYILVYVVSMARAASVPGMRERIGNSFTNRAEAIIHWFTARADRAFENGSN